MASVIQFKRSSVQGKKPQESDLQVGEIALNLFDGLIYSKNTAGNVIVVGSSTTSNVIEGSNLYFTNSRAVSAFTAGGGLNIASNGLISTSLVTGVSSVAGATGAVSNVQIVSGVVQSGILTTANVTEVNNLYFTNTRAISSLTAGFGISIAANGRITSIVSGDGGGNTTIDLNNITSNVNPETDFVYSLGSQNRRWDSLYVANTAVIPADTRVNVNGIDRQFPIVNGGVVSIMVPFYTKALGLNIVAHRFFFRPNPDLMSFTNFTLSNGSLISTTSSRAQFYF